MTKEKQLVHFQGNLVELHHVDYGNGFSGWHGTLRIEVEGLGAVDYHLDLMKLQDFRERGYKVDEEGKVKTFKGGWVLVLAPFQD